MSVVVVGSLNMDLVVRAPHLPAPGETVTGGEFTTYHGGKGANQAVAAARMGAGVRMVGRVGDDAFGRRLIDGLRDEGIDASAVAATPGVASGVALITVDGRGQNTIVVAPGANRRLAPADVGDVAGARVVLLQLEVPMEAVTAAARRGKQQVVILDPAPATPLPDDLYPLLDAIAPNEHEASLLVGFPVTDVESARRAARALRERGVPRAVVKLGPRGLWADLGDEAFHVEGLRVETVDATAAGDALAGALGALLAEGRPWPEALRWANAAAALSTTRRGAQPSLPTRAEVEAFVAARGARP